MRRKWPDGDCTRRRAHSGHGGIIRARGRSTPARTYMAHLSFQFVDLSFSPPDLGGVLDPGQKPGSQLCTVIVPASSLRSTLTTFRHAAGDHVIDFFIASRCRRCKRPVGHHIVGNAAPTSLAPRVNQTPMKCQLKLRLKPALEDAGQNHLALRRRGPVLTSGLLRILNLRGIEGEVRGTMEFSSRRAGHLFSRVGASCRSLG
jgi:hypothetical protein